MHKDVLWNIKALVCKPAMRWPMHVLSVLAIGTMMAQKSMQQLFIDSTVRKADGPNVSPIAGWAYVVNNYQHAENNYAKSEGDPCYEALSDVQITPFFSHFHTLDSRASNTWQDGQTICALQYDVETKKFPCLNEATTGDPTCVMCPTPPGHIAVQQQFVFPVELDCSEMPHHSSGDWHRCLCADSTISGQTTYGFQNYGSITDDTTYNYIANERCEWRLHFDPDAVLDIEFTEFDLFERYDTATTRANFGHYVEISTCDHLTTTCKMDNSGCPEIPHTNPKDYYRCGTRCETITENCNIDYRFAMEAHDYGLQPGICRPETRWGRFCGADAPADTCSLWGTAEQWQCNYPSEPEKVTSLTGGFVSIKFYSDQYEYGLNSGFKLNYYTKPYRFSTIERCPAGTYSGWAASSCTPCAVDYYQPAIAQDRCLPCEFGSHTGGETGMTLCCTGLAQLVNFACVCLPNHYGVDGLNCVQCPKGTYSNGNTWRMVTENTVDGLQIGGVTSHDCICEPGFGWDTALQLCIECGAGYESVKITSSHRVCQACAVGKYKDSIMSSISSCTVCPQGKYAAESGSVECTDCPAGKYVNQARCHELVSSLPIADVAECQSDVSKCVDLTQCVDEASDCVQCLTGLVPNAIQTDCEACLDGHGPDENFVCNVCEAGKVAIQSTSSVGATNTPNFVRDYEGNLIATGHRFGCRSCTDLTGDDWFYASADKTQCVRCDVGFTSNVEGTACVPCANGYFQAGDNRLIISTWNALYHYGCHGCNSNLFQGDLYGGENIQNRYIDTSVDPPACRICPNGKYRDTDNGTVGVEACLDCPACGHQEFRTQCGHSDHDTFIKNNNVVNNHQGECLSCFWTDVVPTSDYASMGVDWRYMENLKQCAADEKRVGCIHMQGHNNVHGYCEKVEFLTRTPLCPDEGSQFGLGGFSYQEIFGIDETDVSFQCREPCVGANVDQGYCAGPFACNVPACSMESEDETQGLTYRVPKGCPEEKIVVSDSESVKRQKQAGKCVLCENCVGRGCAQECSQLLCESGEIYDFSDSRMNKCKQCSDLKNPELCQQDDNLMEELNLTDISGYRAKVSFINCQTRDQLDDYQNPTHAQYGTCESCRDRIVRCDDNQYHAACAIEQECQPCLTHGSREVTQGVYRNESGLELPVYCQVTTCADDKTGVLDDGTLCKLACNSDLCLDDQIELPCVLPHNKRCVPAYPLQRAGQVKVGHVPPWANVLEGITLKPHLFSNFENMLVNVDGTPENQHQCVWNAQSILDNDMNPGGVSHSFEDKFCHVWHRNSDLQYPLLPLQNTVHDSQVDFPRRLLINASARAMHYDYTGEGSVEFEVENMRMAGRPPFTDFEGDLFLTMDVTNAGVVVMQGFVPTDRNLSVISWVPQWELSVLARESTLTVINPPLQLRLGLPGFEEKLTGLDISLIQDNDGAHIILSNHNNWLQGKEEGPVETTPLSHAQTIHRFTPLNADTTVYVSKQSISDISTYNLVHVWLRAGVIDGKQGRTDYVFTKSKTETATAVSALVLTDTDVILAANNGSVCKISDMEGDNVASVYMSTSVVKAYSWPESIESLALWQYNGVSKLMVTLRVLNKKGNFRHTRHEVLDWASQSLDAGIVLDEDRVMKTVGKNTELWCLQTVPGNKYASARWQLARLEPIAVNTQTVYKRHRPSVQVVTSNEAYVLGMNEVFTLGIVLSVNHGKIVMAAPVVSTSSIVYLLLRMYDTTSNSLLSSDDVVVPTNWAYTTVLQNRDSYASHAWKDDSTVLLGFAGEVFEASFSESKTTITRLETSFLVGMHFGVMLQGFITMKVPTDNVVPTQCITGFYKSKMEVPNSLPLHTVSSEVQCSHLCLRTSSCFAYFYNGGCQLILQNKIGTTKVCKKQEDMKYQQLAGIHDRAVAVSHSIQVTALLRGFEKLHGMGSEAKGYFAFAVTDSTTEDFESVSYSHSKLATARKDGVWYSFTLSRPRWENALPGPVEDERMFGVQGAATTSISRFDAMNNYLGNAVATQCSCVGSSGNPYVCNCDGQISMGFADVKVVPLIMVFQLFCDGSYGLDLHTTRFALYTCDSSTPDTMLAIIWDGSGPKRVLRAGQTTMVLNFDFEDLKMYGRTGLILLRETVEMLTDTETYSIMTSLTAQTSKSYSGVDLTDSWVREHRTLSAGAMKVPVLPFTLTVVNPTLTQRFVSVDALKILPQLNVRDSEIMTEGGRMSRVYLPTRQNLEQLSLEVVLHGSNVHNWERLHVTVVVTADDGCRARVMMSELNSEGVMVNTHSDRLKDLGCVAVVDGGVGECQLEIPTSLALVNPRRWIALYVRDTPTCTAMDLSVRLQPMTTLYTCADDEFWSQDAEECMSCQTEIDDILYGMVCPLGQYVFGCDVLADMSNADSLCRPCENTAEKESDPHLEWQVNCGLQCADGYYRDPAGVCVAWTENLRYTCRLQPGMMWAAGTSVQQESCVPCPPLSRSIFTANEEFVGWEGGECNTTCKSGFYRDLEPPHYCVPCTPIELLREELSIAREAGTFYRFQQCGKFQNSQTLQCKVVCEDCADNEFIVTECSANQRTVCQTCAECGDDQYTYAACQVDADTKCIDCKKCAVDEYETRACAGFDNRLCADCLRCQPTEFIAVSCTATTNTICQDCRVCAEGTQYINQTCGLAEDTQCANCTLCGHEQFISKPCNHTEYQGDRQCANCSVCGLAQQERLPCVGQQDRTCESCPPNTFNGEVGAQVCTNCTDCAVDYQETTPCTNVSDRICSIKCAAGQVGNMSDNTCSPCPANFFSDEGSYACVPCPENSMSNPGSARCTCPYGFYGNKSFCAACPVATYKDFVGDNLPCALCPEGTFGNQTGASVCQACSNNEFAAEGSSSCNTCVDDNSQSTGTKGSVTSCTCNAGFTGDHTSCQACLPGKFKSEVANNQACADCPAGTASNRTAQTNISDCQQCGVDLYSYTGSVFCLQCTNHAQSLPGSQFVEACTCNPGFTGDHLSCEACLPGKYKADVANNQACTDCPAGTASNLTGMANISECQQCEKNEYSYPGSVSCSPCTDNSQSLPGSPSVEACTCNPGFSGDHTQCLACLAGKFKSDMANDQACTDCPAGTASNLTALTNVSDCQQCGVDLYSYAGSTTCEPCTENSQSLPGSPYIEACTCNIGFGGNASECRACIPGKYKADVANAECDNCPAGTSSNVSTLTTVTNCKQCQTNTYAYAGQSECSLCVPNSQSAPGSKMVESCICDPGFSGNHTGCAPCALGTFKGVPGPAPCELCAAGTFAGVLGIVSCEECPALSDSFAGDSICTCNAGASGPDGGVCNLCQPGKFKSVSGPFPCEDCAEGFYTATPNGTVHCTECMNNSVTEGVGSESIHACMCISGWFHSSLSTCTKCDPGTFNADLGQWQCSDCAAGTYSGGGVASCQTCPNNTYSHLGSHSCTQCNLNAVSPEGSTLLADCDCKPGFKKDGVHCVACDPGFFKPNIGDDQNCTACAVGEFQDIPASDACKHCDTLLQGGLEVNRQTSGVASGSSDDCVCKAGFVSANGSHVCKGCAEGLYKASSGDHGCDLCPENTWSSVRGEDVAGTYCVPCARHKTAIAGSQEDVCQCVPGFITTVNTTFSAHVYTTIELGSGSVTTVNEQIEQNVCGACAPGLFNNELDGSCEACAVGSYTNQLNSTSCQACTPHATTWAQGSQECDCIAGFARNFTMQKTVTACEKWAGDGCTNSGTAHEWQLRSIDETATVRCCSMTGNSCYSSFGGCFPSTATYAEAEEACAAAGYRICTRDEVTARKCCGTGCGYDNNLIWSSDNGALCEYPEPPCEACVSGKYKLEMGDHLCSDCKPCDDPLKSNLGCGGVNFGICSCSPGSFGADHLPAEVDSTPCALCAAGYYQSEYGQGSCNDICGAGYYSLAGASVCESCPAGTHSTTVGATSETFCEPCPAGTMSGPHAQSCSDCFYGTYSDASGSSVCESCGAGRWSGMVASECVDCVPGKYYDGITAWYFVTMGCLGCSAGTYSNTTRASFCYTCVAGTSTQGSETACTDCSAGEFAAVDGDRCANCPAGKYSASSRATKCDDCVAGTFSAERSTACTNCSAGEFSGAAAGVCEICSAGTFSAYTKATECDICAAGTFSADKASVCTNCSRGEYSTGSASECQTCPVSTFADRVASTSINDCIPCTVCANDTYYETPCSREEDTVCVTCPAGQYYLESMYNNLSHPGCTSCHECQPPSSVDVGGKYVTTPCTTMYNRECSLCQECDNLHAITQECNASNEAGQDRICTACPTNSIRRQGVAYCSCKPGYWQDSQCAQCPANTYDTQPVTGEINQTLFIDACKQCPLHAISSAASTSISDCKCVANFFQLPDYTCQQCHAFSASLPGSKNLSDCKCIPGYTGPVGGPCVPCRENTYKSTTDNVQCDLCNLPPNTGLYSPAASTSFTNCTCAPGSVYEPDYLGPDQCAGNHYWNDDFRKKNHFWDVRSRGNSNGRYYLEKAREIYGDGSSFSTYIGNTPKDDWWMEITQHQYVEQLGKYYKWMPYVQQDSIYIQIKEGTCADVGGESIFTYSECAMAQIVVGYDFHYDDEFNFDLDIWNQMRLGAKYSNYKKLHSNADPSFPRGCLRRFSGPLDPPVYFPASHYRCTGTALYGDGCDEFHQHQTFGYLEGEPVDAYPGMLHLNEDCVCECECRCVDGVNRYNSPYSQLQQDLNNNADYIREQYEFTIQEIYDAKYEHSCRKVCDSNYFERSTCSGDGLCEYLGQIDNGHGVLKWTYALTNTTQLTCSGDENPWWKDYYESTATIPPDSMYWPTQYNSYYRLLLNDTEMDFSDVCSCAGRLSSGDYGNAGIKYSGQRSKCSSSCSQGPPAGNYSWNLTLGTDPLWGYESYLDDTFTYHTDPSIPWQKYAADKLHVDNVTVDPWPGLQTTYTGPVYVLCRCPPPNLGRCVGCREGTYRPDPNSATSGVDCIECPENTFSKVISAANIDTCEPCPANSESLPGSASCQCSAGASGPDDGPCTLCVANSAKLTVGDAKCQCNAGFSGPEDGPCTACVAGTFKSSSISEACTLCPENTYLSVVGATSVDMCVSCFPHSVSPAGSIMEANCTCPPGRQYDSATHSCVTCPPGTSKNYMGLQACASCPVDTYAVQGVNCTECPLGAVSQSGSADIYACKCDEGWTGADGGPCAQCAAGKFKTDIGDSECASCESGTYNNHTGSSEASDCQRCPDNTQSPPNSTSLQACICNAGYSGPDGGPCVHCQAGTFKSSPGKAACVHCAVGTYVDTQAAVSCIQCGDHYSTLFYGSTSDQCLCEPGFTRPDSATLSPCVACTPGTYQHELSLDPCLKCPPGSFNDESGRTNCTLCQAGKYMDQTNATVCTECSTVVLSGISPVGSVSASNCTCATGYTRELASPMNLACRMTSNGNKCPCSSDSTTWTTITQNVYFHQYYERIRESLPDDSTLPPYECEYQITTTVPNAYIQTQLLYFYTGYGNWLKLRDADGVFQYQFNRYYYENDYNGYDHIQGTSNCNYPNLGRRCIPPAETTNGGMWQWEYLDGHRRWGWSNTGGAPYTWESQYNYPSMFEFSVQSLQIDRCVATP